jgi:hypothetical protein
MSQLKKPRGSQRRNSSTQKKRVLADHRKHGKKLIPPYVAILGRPDNVSWINTIIPEVLWIGLLHETFGRVEGTALALKLARLADRSVGGSGASFFAATSDFSKLNVDEKTAIISGLAFSKELDRLRIALLPLLHFYPTCPFNFLSTQENPSDPSFGLDCLKRVLFDLFDKRLRRTVLVQATVVYIAFVLERLKVVKGLTLARFPEVENYPDTEISKRVASAIRVAVLSFFGPARKDMPSTWSIEFWNRGIEIEPCQFK